MAVGNNDSSIQIEQLVHLYGELSDLKEKHSSHVYFSNTGEVLKISDEQMEPPEGTEYELELIPSNKQPKLHWKFLTQKSANNSQISGPNFLKTAKFKNYLKNVIERLKEHSNQKSNIKAFNNKIAEAKAIVNIEQLFKAQESLNELDPKVAAVSNKVIKKNSRSVSLEQQSQETDSIEILKDPTAETSVKIPTDVISAYEQRHQQRAEVLDDEKTQREVLERLEKIGIGKLIEQAQKQLLQSSEQEETKQRNAINTDEQQDFQKILLQESELAERIKIDDFEKSQREALIAAQQQDLGDVVRNELDAIVQQNVVESEIVDDVIFLDPLSVEFKTIEPEAIDVNDNQSSPSSIIDPEIIKPTVIEDIVFLDQATVTPEPQSPSTNDNFNPQAVQTVTKPEITKPEVIDEVVFLDQATVTSDSQLLSTNNNLDPSQTVQTIIRPEITKPKVIDEVVFLDQATVISDPQLLSANNNLDPSQTVQTITRPEITRPQAIDDVVFLDQATLTSDPQSLSTNNNLDLSQTIQTITRPEITKPEVIDEVVFLDQATVTSDPQLLSTNNNLDPSQTIQTVTRPEITKPEVIDDVVFLDPAIASHTPDPQSPPVSDDNLNLPRTVTKLDIKKPPVIEDVVFLDQAIIPKIDIEPERPLATDNTVKKLIIPGLDLNRLKKPVEIFQLKTANAAVSQDNFAMTYDTKNSMGKVIHEPNDEINDEHSLTLEMLLTSYIAGMGPDMIPDIKIRHGDPDLANLFYAYAEILNDAGMEMIINDPSKLIDRELISDKKLEIVQRFAAESNPASLGQKIIGIYFGGKDVSASDKEKYLSLIGHKPNDKTNQQSQNSPRYKDAVPNKGLYFTSHSAVDPDYAATPRCGGGSKFGNLKDKFAAIENKLNNSDRQVKDIVKEFTGTPKPIQKIKPSG